MIVACVENQVMLDDLCGRRVFFSEFVYSKNAPDGVFPELSRIC